MRRAPIWLAAILLTACGSISSTVPDPVVQAIRAAPSTERIHAINAAAHRHRAEPASLAAFLADPDLDVRWAAAYVACLWADDASDVASLAPLLSDDSEAVRAIVAGSLAGLGHAAARDVLAALRASSTAMPFSDPPVTVGQFSSGALAAIDRAGGVR
jgi:HEAT repeat protein